ncbi:MAG: sugar phosphate isomerase/epimerase [Clostridiales bacterium]|nr:sugar phosphate isomerase/epimerase [Clostridiales bacterium]
MKYSVQLYTLRSEIKDAEGLKRILPEVRKAGYEGVEFAGTYGYDPVTLKQLCDDSGLIVTGNLVGVDAFLPDKIDSTIAYNKALGLNLIGTGGGPHGTDADAEKTALIFKWANKYGENKGVKFYYHNHQTEFFPLESGRLPIDVLKTGAYLEIDTYWSFVAKVDTRKVMLENRDRIVALHIKDGVDGTPCALGEGQNDLITIIKTAKEIGVEWLTLENDNPTPNGLDDIKRSYAWLAANEEKF